MAARALTWAVAVAARALAGIGTRTGVIGVPAGPMVLGNATKPMNGRVGVDQGRGRGRDQGRGRGRDQGRGRSRMT